MSPILDPRSSVLLVLVLSAAVLVLDLPVTVRGLVQSSVPHFEYEYRLRLSTSTIS